MKAADLILLLNLEPLPQEGGFYRETYRSLGKVGNRNYSTAIYFLITQENFSAFHRVPQDEIFHFYLGNPVELVQIDLKGNLTKDILGPKLLEGQSLQKVVSGNFWQALRLLEQGEWALLGTTVSPGFDFKDFELADRQKLLEQYPQYQSDVIQLTR